MKNNMVRCVWCVSLIVFECVGLKSDRGIGTDLGDAIDNELLHFFGLFKLVAALFGMILYD